jgi:hypothetical protein
MRKKLWFDQGLEHGMIAQTAIFDNQFNRMLAREPNTVGEQCVEVFWRVGWIWL